MNTQTPALAVGKSHPRHRVDNLVVEGAEQKGEALTLSLN